jgi:hypothetical protein
MSSNEQLWRRASGRHAEVQPEPFDTEEFAAPSLIDDLADPDEPGDGATLDTPAVVDELSDPFADDLDEQLAARAPQRWANRATTILLGLVLLVGGFFGGAQVEKHFGTVSSASSQNAGGGGFNAGNFRAGRGGGQTGGGQTGGGQTGGGAQAAANTRTGTVKLVDGTTVYITTADGQTVTVRTNGSTAVQVTQPGTLADLAPGTQVSVDGPAASDGTVTATKVTRAK